MVQFLLLEVKLVSLRLERQLS